MTQKMESLEYAQLLLTVLNAHGCDVDAALGGTTDILPRCAPSRE